MAKVKLTEEEIALAEAERKAQELHLNKMKSIYDDFKENIHKYESSFTLQRFSLIAFARLMWTSDDIKRKITAYSFDKSEDKQKKWREIEEEVLDRAVYNKFAHNFRCEIEFIIANFAIQIYEWIEILETNSKDNELKPYVTNIIWTKYGTIDKRKSFESLLNHKILITNGSLYNLACNFCFVEHIIHLWHQLPELLKRDYKSKSLKNAKKGSEMIVFWSCVNNYKINWISHNKMSDKKISKEMFSFALKGKIDLSVQYFWKQINLEDKEKYIVKCSLIGKVNESENFIFLLSQMSLEEMILVIENNIEELLNHLIHLKRPQQEFFIPTVVKLLEFVNIDFIKIIMLIIANNICKNGVQGLVYKQVLIEIWKNSPNVVKSEMLTTKKDQLFALFIYNGLEVFKVIINDLNIDKKYEIMTSKKCVCINMVINGGEIMLENFLNDIFGVEKDLIINFKKELAYCGINFIRILLIKDKYEMFIKWCFSSEDEITEFKVNYCNYSFLERELRTFCTERTVENVEKFLNWCLLSDDERKGLKEVIASNELKASESKHGKIYEDDRCLFLTPRDRFSCIRS